jgi:type II secretory pathway component PulC
MVKPNLKKTIEDLQLPEMLAPIISSEKGRYVSLGVLALAAALVLIALFNTFSTWYGDFRLSQQHPTTLAALNDNEEAGLIANIPDQHLFGQQSVEDTDFLPVTSLQLRLTGVIIQAHNNLSRVIISEGGQPGKIYSIGEEVAAGIKINAINDDGIVLEHGGHFEKLPLARTGLTFNDKPQTIWQKG